MREYIPPLIGVVVGFALALTKDFFLWIVRRFQQPVLQFGGDTAHIGMNFEASQIHGEPALTDIVARLMNTGNGVAKNCRVFLTHVEGRTHKQTDFRELDDLMYPLGFRIYDDSTRSIDIPPGVSIAITLAHDDEHSGFFPKAKKFEDEESTIYEDLNCLRLTVFVLSDNGKPVKKTYELPMP